MMKVHLLSDLHNEFDTYKPSAVDVDIVILAGDIDVKARGVEWAKQTFQVPVLYLLGNHEYYSGHMPKTLEKMRSASVDSQVQVLERDVVIVAGTRFLGATMWTDFSATGNKPLASITAQSMMNDYRQIRAGEHYRRIKPGDLAGEALKTRDWLLSKLAKPFSGPTVVITYHAPLLRSLAESPHAVARDDFLTTIINHAEIPLLIGLVASAQDRQPQRRELQHAPHMTEHECDTQVVSRNGSATHIECRNTGCDTTGV